MAIVDQRRQTQRLPLLCALLLASGVAHAGSFDVFGVDTDWKLTLGYATASRVSKPAESLVNGPIDVMHVNVDPTGNITGFGHTGLHTTTNFDDGNRDFNRWALLNNRLSAYFETNVKFDSLGLGNLGFVGSGSGFYDLQYFVNNDFHYRANDDQDSVNREHIVVDRPNHNYGTRVGPINHWMGGAVDYDGRRFRLLEAYGYGDWNLTDTIGLSLRAGKHLAAWGESLFFPGVAAAQGPDDATKAFVPGAEVKEILLPVNQVSMQLSLTPALSVLAYKQFEFRPTELFPQGDFFNPADLIGAGASFGYGSINPVSPRWCTDGNHVQFTLNGSPVDNATACAIVLPNFTNTPEYIYTLRTPDKMPGTDKQYGVGLKYQLFSNLNLGAYYLVYNNHNPNVILHMGPATLGDLTATGQPIDTGALNIPVPVSYTVAYADDVKMEALSFSTVWWVFNLAGEVYRRENIDTSLEGKISGVYVPWGTRGTTDSAQMSALYVNNPNFIYDEVVFVGEIGFLHVEKVDPVQNQVNLCMSNTSPADCASSTPHEYGDHLFYSRDSSAFQFLVLPKIRNAFAGWDFGTPLAFSWLFSGTPSTPGVFGPLYGEGDMRAGLGIDLQYLQNLDFSFGYNAFFGNVDKTIGRSDLKANPYTDKDYAYFNIKYNL